MSCLVLPEELIVEILSWVPVNDLLRFRCVSKWLCFLVFDPTFIKLHLLHTSSRKTHILLTFEDCCKKMTLTFEDNRIKEENMYCAPCSMHDLLHDPSSTIQTCHTFNVNVYKVLGVCNGLVCLLASYLENHHGHDQFKEYWVRFWNPATRVISEDSPRIPVSRFRRSSEFGFGFGFGYDDSSDTYQVVVLDTKGTTTEMKVHSFGDTCWKNTLTLPAFRNLSLEHAASVSGAVNWLALRNLKSEFLWDDVTMDDLVIFSYDLKNESYRYLSIPNGVFEVSSIIPQLEVLKGCLCLSHICGPHRRRYFRLWLMKEFEVQGSWTHLLNISYEKFDIDGLGMVCTFPDHPRILCISEDNQVILLVNEGRWKLSLYNMRNNTIERCGDWDKGRLKFLSYDYVPSLVMPYLN